MALKIMCISDTHCRHRSLELDLEGVDCIIHSGDFSSGSEASTIDFLLWYSELYVKHKILIAGNHDWFAYNYQEDFKRKCELLDIIYLDDSECTIEGVVFYGTPWVNKFYNWAFMEYENNLKDIYKKISKGVHVLISHGPAHGTLDVVLRAGAGSVGSTSLRDHLPKLKRLKAHIFGHIHENYGIVQHQHYVSVNASILDANYRIHNNPVIIEV